MARFLPTLALLVACGGSSEDRVADIVALEGDSVAGESVYLEQCASCHGDDGEGVTAPALAGAPAAYSDEQLTTLILDGAGGMPAHDYMSDDEIADVMAYVRSTY